jgi:hypothetical protein
MNDHDDKQRAGHDQQQGRDRTHTPGQQQDGDPRDTDPERGQDRLSAWQVVGSTVASAFGVQSSRNRERDFSQGKASHFIIAGVVFTVLFVLGVILVVNLVLSAAA